MEGKNLSVMTRNLTDKKPAVKFDCSKCPAYCCSVYERVSVNERDLKRLAKHFKLTVEQARRRHTKLHSGERVLRRSPDPIFGEACKFLDRETRGCTIYHARPSVCREYPDRTTCAYYDLLKFERRQQGDPSVIPLVQISFREVEKTIVEDDGDEMVWEWSPIR
jgi:Fe-S-cluster containining protein